MKKVLRKHKLDFKTYQVLEFLAIVIVMIPLIWFFWRLSPEALTAKSIGIFAFIIIASTIANLLTFYAFKREKVTELEPIRLFQPLLVILIAFLIYTSERQTSIHILGAALIASLALIFSHIEKHHIKFNKYMIAALFGSLFFAIELVASKAILPYYSPLSFYFVRCTFVFLISFAIIRPKFSGVSKQSWIYIFIIGAIWVGYRAMLYYGFIAFGVIFTTLLFILGPIFIYLLAATFLKEKLTWRNIIAGIIILACVAYAISVA